MNHQEQENAESRSESEAIAALEVEIQEFAAQKQACAARVKELMFSEDTAAGIVHAKEIFMLQQDKLRLQVEMDCRRNKINRIRKFGLANELQNSPPQPDHP
ncbi:hypothetical protein SAMN05660653_00564 [Desulfonatronum thiosulfatophilum]|uniref:GTD-binding domain-containing protein n=1 Tax=Desulfonatronum thiosulfatophilum TaxID=617002 RepID=A0A1G6AU31_9BACT|nr:hypothetical protein [Desulfonatronum thiosulfatophilum]SDB11916.1 hypothetical protein SAMN05660653_00564 [Desulfonatronum thiosulfatophilum]